MLKVKYTPIAIQDLNAGYDYIYGENPMAARQVIERIEQTVIHLKYAADLLELGKDSFIN